MWVSSLVINNIRSFEVSGTINLDRKMNILLGANNSGKSSILRMLYLIQNIHCLIPSDIRVGYFNASALINLEDIDNTTVADYIKNGFLPKIYIDGRR